jgi:hypothetical protein
MKNYSTIRRLLCVAFVVVAIGVAADPVGTWKVNFAKSSVPPTSTIVSRVMNIEKLGPNKYRNIFDDLTKAGEKRHTESIRIFDGQEYPVPERGSGYTQLCERIDAMSDRITQKRDGKIVSEVTTKLSGDGRVRTSKMKTFSNDGEPVESVWVYEKQ